MDRNGKVMKVLTVFGTRPEAIKMCPVIKAIRQEQGIECIVCLTGQHREMLNQVMDIFHIQGNYNLDIMEEDQTLSKILSKVVLGMDSIINSEKPDLIMVHGDTSSAFAASLSAFYHQIPIAHVEAGLRTYNFNSPYPEEFNRQAIDLITDFYFAPTENAKNQLLLEGKRAEKIFVTGNTVIDALKTTVVDEYYSDDLEWAKDSKLVLLTAHRRENIGQPMINIFKAVKRIVDEFHVKVIYPIHMNPRVRELATMVFGKDKRIRIIEPLDVFDFHNYMSRSYLILTDSGGIQEEAPSLGIPVLVMRDTTERPEGVEAGTLKLVGTSEESIYQNAKELLLNQREYERMSNLINPYGDGHASERIVNIIRGIAR